MSYFDKKLKKLQVLGALSLFLLPPVDGGFTPRPPVSKLLGLFRKSPPEKSSLSLNFF